MSIIFADGFDEAGLPTWDSSKVKRGVPLIRYPGWATNTPKPEEPLPAPKVWEGRNDRALEELLDEYLKNRKENLDKEENVE